MSLKALGSTQAGIFAEFRDLAERWRADAKWLKRYSPSDPVASTLERVADDLDALAKAIDGNDVYLTADEYAELQRVTPQSVRKWIREGKLRAIADGAGRYLIRRHEVVDKTRHDPPVGMRTRGKRAPSREALPDPLPHELPRPSEPPRARPPYKPTHWNDPNHR